MPAFPASAFDGEVTYAVDAHGVALLTLNAPARMNTMSKAMSSGVMLALDMAAEDPAVKVVVLTGAGRRAFCAGGTLGDASDGAATGFIGKQGAGLPPTAAAAVRTLRTAMGSSSALREMDKVTIAAVNGACAGAGLSWACACDLRVAAEGAIFRTAFATAGLSGDFGGSWTLPRIVGPARARELYLLNRKVGAREAKEIGLVSEVFGPDELLPRALELARAIAAGPALATRRIKQNLNAADACLSFSEAMDGEAERHARTAMHPDAIEAGAAFVQKRPPAFVGAEHGEAWRMSKL